MNVWVIYLIDDQLRKKLMDTSLVDPTTSGIYKGYCVYGYTVDKQLLDLVISYCLATSYNLCMISVSQLMSLGLSFLILDIEIKICLVSVFLFPFNFCEFSGFWSRLEKMFCNRFTCLFACTCLGNVFCYL